MKFGGDRSECGKTLGLLSSGQLQLMLYVWKPSKISCLGQVNVVLIQRLPRRAASLFESHWLEHPGCTKARLRNTVEFLFGVGQSNIDSQPPVPSIL